MDPDRVRYLQQMLELQPHPEGGFYGEYYRQAADAATAIYYLLTPGARSAWHRLDKDEIWHHYEGAPVELHLIWPAQGDAAARYEKVILGPVSPVCRPSRLVPAGVWQAARPMPADGDGSRGNGYSLVGNTVAPGFHFEGWTLADAAMRARLAEAVPAAAEALQALGAEDVETF